MCRQRHQTGIRIWIPDLDRAVPRTGEKGVFGYEVPVHREHFAGVFLPRLHGKLGEGNVKELDRAIAAGGEDLVLVRFRPGAVEERILGIEPGDLSNIQPTRP